MICRLLTITGVVQGVGFRFGAYHEAKRIGGLLGWVRNLSNGDVEVIVQGEEAKVEALIVWCRKGPERCKVKECREQKCALRQGMTPFEVRT